MLNKKVSSTFKLTVKNRNFLFRRNEKFLTVRSVSVGVSIFSPVMPWCVEAEKGPTHCMKNKKIVPADTQKKRGEGKIAGTQTGHGVIYGEDSGPGPAVICMGLSIGLQYKKLRPWKAAQYYNLYGLWALTGSLQAVPRP